ncbi:c-type cytochrome, partial [Kaarinaea lacus]
GQDPKYIVNALKHYADGKRTNDDMANAVKELNVEQMRDVATYYAAQTPVQLENINVPKAPEVLAEQCNRCHGENGFSTEADKPRLAGQIEAYLANALRSYRDGTRESTAMHAMADVLTLTELKAIAAYYSEMQR